MPGSIGLSKLWFERVTHFIKKSGSLRARHDIGKWLREYLEPGENISRQLRRPGYQLDIVDGKAESFEQFRVFFCRRIIPRVGHPGIDAAPTQGGMKRGPDGLDVALAAELTDESAARLQTARHAVDNAFGPFHPVKRGIGENGIEAPLERETVTVHKRYVEPARSRGLEERIARVNADDQASSLCDFLREDTITASEIQNCFSGLSIQQDEQGFAKVRDKAGVFRISHRVPRSRHSRRIAFEVGLKKRKFSVVLPA